jgi:hypothetical protein
LTEPGLKPNLSATAQRLNIAIPQSTYADGNVDLNIQRTVSGDSIISEVALEENTRFENNRYAAPPPTPPPGSPQVVLSALSASWSNNQVGIHWETTTEINNSAFKIYRSTGNNSWTEIASRDSLRACGNYIGTAPVAYDYTDTSVVSNTTYYYRLQFSGENCGAGTIMSTMTAKAQPESGDLTPPA